MYPAMKTADIYLRLFPTTKCPNKLLKQEINKSSCSASKIQWDLIYSQ